MRPLRLELKGFTAFRHTASVDFRDRTLFAITGPTGAGKSSLLDAMIWALYGQVPRVGRATKQLVTHGEKSMAVRFEFRARGHTYRVTRSTSGTLGARLEQLSADGERWIPLADRAAEVLQQVTAILGLDYQTFTRTIVLPQGQFDSFLRGEDKDRRDILSTLLGLDSYEHVGRAARLRSRGARQAVEFLDQQLARLTLATPEALAALEAERARLESAAGEHATMRERLASLHELAQARLTAEQTQRGIVEATRSASRAAAEASAASEHAERQREQAIAQHERLDGERAAIAYDARAHRALQRALELLELREEALRALDRARADAEAGVRGLEAAAALEAAARSEAEGLARSSSAAAEAHAGAAASLRAASGLGARAIEALGALLDAAQRAALEADAEAAEHERHGGQLEALALRARAIDVEHGAVASALRDAEKAQRQALAGQKKSAARLSEAEGAVEAGRSVLDAARLEHAAAALRGDLHEGDDCPVCGSHIEALPEHESADLGTAQAGLDRATFVLVAAREAHEAATSAVAAASARLEEQRAALARLETRRTELDGELASAGGATLALEEAAAIVHAQAAQAVARAAEQRRVAAASRDARHALELLLAQARAVVILERSPEAVRNTEEEPAELAARAATDLQAAIEATSLAAEAAARAANAARAAEEQARATVEAAARARQLAAARLEALRTAEAHLASLGTVDAGAGLDVRAALADAERQAALAAALEARAQQAATQIAVLGQLVEERRSASARAADALREHEANGVRAAERVATAIEAFAVAWRELLGQEHPPDVTALESLRARLEADARVDSHRLGELGARLEQARSETEQAAQLRGEIAAHKRTAQVAGALEQELHADRFIAYVQREALAVLAADASTRLMHLTAGRYRLVTDHDEFWVVDHLNGEERRSVKTLSGGETFLASLALALALSERLPELAGSGGAVSLESLFLDEGFGSLDAEALDIAIEGLERLAGGRRLIGVISHVPELSERLPDRIEVIKAPDSSRIAGGDVAPARAAPAQQALEPALAR